MSQKILITGAAGQLGRELQRTAPAGAELLAATRERLDITDADQVRAFFSAQSPDVVINAAAYTAVDKAESEPAQAMAVNRDAAANLARACAQSGTRMLHVSTDFVFDGKACTPYAPDAATSPLGEYGRSKLAGEVAVTGALPGALVMRTAWVYSVFGGNFVKTMLRLMADREELSVVADQVGTPTWARGLASALWQAVARPDLEGVHHWTDAGVCSWYDFAVAIAEEGVELNLLQRMPVVHPIPGSAYPTPAKRPAYSVLDKDNTWQALATEGLHWRVQLRAMLQELKEL
ncbi:dTDP-4-dehydrorhamnose reductase [Seongchinamella unica]|uniref:dTDP-4-dehydrorhamnose reductase n=1 Tax=Seongchinamella unica TaxID=2547392 RepID=A0A4R5LWI6_9GAMM|nr:dTDP-4-dehydrorhamnose reductase [Seongchinamella unica]TDG15844.1 dTDP-4-dehydrorhamnose reductase [Seongchinamella unica]